MSYTTPVGQLMLLVSYFLSLFSLFQSQVETHELPQTRKEGKRKERGKKRMISHFQDFFFAPKVK